jgi:hypothetical protein
VRDDSLSRLALVGQFNERLAAAPIPIAEVALRRPVVVAGKVMATTVLERGGFRTLTAYLEDGTGVVELVFLGRCRLSGLEAGRFLSADGVIGRLGRRLRMLNPVITLYPALGED